MHKTYLESLQYEEVISHFETTRIDSNDANRQVRLFLSQSPHPDSLLGRRMRLFGGQHHGEPAPEEVRDFLSILSRIPPDADLVVLSEHSAAGQHLETLQNLATANRQVIVSALGFARAGTASHNSIAVALPDRRSVVLQKVSFSVEDQQQAQDGKLLRGGRLVVFDTTLGRFAVLNCHEYTHSQLLHVLSTKSIDFLIVTSFNPAWKLYGEYAIADIHRMFCFVVMCNVGNYGGTGVYAPFSKLWGSRVRLGQ